MEYEQNVLSLHQQMMHYFTKDQKTIQELDERIGRLDKIIKDQHTSSEIQRGLMEEYKNLQSLKTRIETQEDVQFYLINVIPVIEEYKNELNKPIHIDFMSNTVQTDNKRKKELYYQYMEIVNQCFPEYKHILHKKIELKSCTLCSKPLEQVNQSFYVCKSCGHETQVSQNIFSYKDNERINITKKYTYDRRVHFRDCINQFQGKQQSTISQDVYDKLYKKLEMHGLDDKTKEDKRERFKNVTKQHITMFLKETGYSKHYEDLNLIYHNITGAPLPDISHLEEKLVQDFDELNELYEKHYIKTKKIKRKNFINTQYVLFQLLRRHKFPCDKNDFNFLKTTERKYFHDTICSELFNILGWNFSNVF